MSVFLITGGSSASGIATASALLARFPDATVVTVGSNTERITAAAAATGATGLTCDLTDSDAVAELAAMVTGFGPLTGLIHLVGGWRGGGSLAEQSDPDWEFLERHVVGTLRTTTRALADQLGPDGAKLVIVSTTGLDQEKLAAQPAPGNANYLAAKAAAEAWTRAVGNGVVIRVKALVTDQMRADSPERKFPGYTHVNDLGVQIADSF